MQVQFSQIRLLVNNFPACFQFYRDVVGLPVGFGSESDVYADFALGDNKTLGLFRRDLMAEAVGTQSKPASVIGQDSALVAFQVDNVDEAVEALQAKGVQLVASPTDHPDWGMRTAHFRDPDGTLLEIFHPIEMT